MTWKTLTRWREASGAPAETGLRGALVRKIMYGWVAFIAAKSERDECATVALNMVLSGRRELRGAASMVDLE